MPAEHPTTATSATNATAAPAATADTLAASTNFANAEFSTTTTSPTAVTASPGGAERAGLATLVPVIKKLIVWQLLLGSVCLIALVAHTLYAGPAHQQRQLDNQALALQRAVSALSWTQLSSTTANASNTPDTAPAQAILQAILAGQPTLLEVSLQAGGYHWRAAVAPDLPGRSLTGKPLTNRRALRSEHQFVLHSPTKEPVNATLVMLATSSTGLHSGLLATGFALALASSIIALLGLNQQLQTETSALLRRLPGQTDATTQSPAQPPAPPDLVDAEPAATLLLQPLCDAVERAVTIRSRDNRPMARTESTAVSQRELELAQQSAVRAGRIKSNIIAKTSHELLTPLNSIAGFSAILARETAAGSQNQEFAQLIHDNAQQLNTLVNDLIVFSDRETNAIKLRYQPTNLYQLLASIAKSVAPAIAAQGLELRTDFEAIKTFTLDTDPVRVRQIISNLLTNALRNTASGHIGIAAKFENTPENSRWVKIAVSDSGCGIDTAKQQSIFNEFVSNTTRFNKTVSQQPGSEIKSPTHAAKDEDLAAAANGAYTSDAGLGFGLGLAIVDDLCHRMGASVELQSAINQGTTFTINLPARNIVTAPDNAATGHNSRAQMLAGQGTPSRDILIPSISRSAAHTTGLPTLVVDDNQSNLILLRHLLNTSGCHCDTASSGEQAMAMLQQHRYAWLFIDIRMQPIDGFELRKNIRALPVYKRAPIIACTAHTSDDEYRHLIDTGFDAVLHKPVSERRLAELHKQFKGALAGLGHAHTSAATPALVNTSYSKNISSTPPTPPTPTTQTENATTTQPVYQVQAAIEHSGGNSEVAKSICVLIIEELASALHLQRRGFTRHSDRLEHFHRLNGSASMGGTPELKRLLHSFESRLKICPDLADSTLAQQQQAIEVHQMELLQWLQQQDIDRLFDTA